MASYRFLIRRTLTLPLDREQHGKWQQILHIAHNKNFPTNLLTWLKLRTQQSISQPEPPSPTSLGNRTKWAMFTYTSPQISKVTNIFKQTNIRIAFKCNNTLSRLSKLNTKTHPTIPYDKCGIYSLSCVMCNKEYVGQTRCSIDLRYKEHESYIKYNSQSACALHILSDQQEYGPIEKNNDSSQTHPKHFVTNPL